MVRLIFTNCIFYKNLTNGIFDKKANNVDWTEDETLKLKRINMKLLKSYEKDIDIVARWTQGMTVTDKYVLFTLWKSDDDTTMIAIADKNTGEILNIVDGYNFKHANDMTYDSKNDYIYILTSSKKIAKFKINAQYQITDLQYVTCNREYSGIAYNQDVDGFVGLAGKKVYVTNNKFEEQYFFDVPTNLTTQGIGYYEGNIYYCCTENGVPSQYQPIYNNKERLSNLIYKYNLKGELVETLYIPNTTLYGEIEGCAFEDDGTLVASYKVNFGAKATVSLYKSNIIPPVLEVLYNVTELTNKDVSVRINSNKELQEVLGWTLSENKKSLIRTYSSNIQEDVIVKDLFDNSSVATINITNIDKEKPILELNTEVTTTIIKVQVAASDTGSGINEHSYKYYIRKENGTYGEAVPDGYAHTFNQLSSNQEYDIKVEVSDNVGNIGSKEIQITIKKSNKVTSTTYKIDEENLIIKEIQPNTKIGEIKDKIQGDIEYKIINSKGETVLDTQKLEQDIN